MELTKKKPDLKFTHKELTFTVRAVATAGDKYEIDCLYDVKGDGLEINRRMFYLTLIERFVTGWEGVTENGKPVPFSLANLLSLPYDHEDDIVIILGSWITNHVGIFKQADDKKKGN